MNNQPKNCPGCTSSADSLEYLRTRQASANGVEYSLWSCKTCGLQFWTPLEMITSIYEDEGFEAYSDYHSGDREFPFWADTFFAEIVEPYGTSLDVGCADGAVVERLKATGFDAMGIDLDSRSLAIARKTRGLDQLFHGTLQDFISSAPEYKQHFNLITFFEVLEHQVQPLAFLSDVRGLANDGASIAGSVPNRSRFLVSLDRALSDGDYPPHHFLWFSRTALCSILDQAGFVDVNINFGARPGYARRVRSISRIICRGLGYQNGNTTSTFIRYSALILAAPMGCILSLGDYVKPPKIYFTCRSRTISTHSTHDTQ